MPNYNVILVLRATALALATLCAAPVSSSAEQFGFGVPDLEVPEEFGLKMVWVLRSSSLNGLKDIKYIEEETVDFCDSILKRLSLDSVRTATELNEIVSDRIWSKNSVEIEGREKYLRYCAGLTWRNAHSQKKTIEDAETHRLLYIYHTLELHLAEIPLSAQLGRAAFHFHGIPGFLFRNERRSLSELKPRRNLQNYEKSKADLMTFKDLFGKEIEKRRK